MQMSSAVIPPPGAAVHCLTLLSNGQMEAFLRSNPAHSRFSTCTTSSRCGSVCGSAPSGAFSAATSICFSPSPPLLLPLERAAAQPSPTPARRAGRSIRPLCVLTAYLPVCAAVFGCGCSQVQGRGRAGRASSLWASFRGHRDRDDGRQDADGGGAEQHRLDFCGCGRVCILRNRPGICGAFTGAHRHHHLDLLVHLVVLAQVENDTLDNMVTLRTATGVSECLPPAV